MAKDIHTYQSILKEKGKMSINLSDQSSNKDANPKQFVM